MTGSMTSGDVVSELRAALAPHGVFLRGVVGFEDGEGAPALADGRAARTVILLGNIGGSIWSAFDRWRAGLPDRGGDDPLDRWSKAVLGPVADQVKATTYFPSDPPWQPFQQWAMRAEGLRASPLGILLHPDYGLWHGYRGALGFADVLPTDLCKAKPHPCDSCSAKPCLSGCPVDAVLASGFQITSCRAHLKTLKAGTDCMKAGCLARNACPVGAVYRYSAAQLRFHMDALSL